MLNDNLYQFILTWMRKIKTSNIETEKGTAKPRRDFVVRLLFIGLSCLCNLKRFITLKI